MSNKCRLVKMSEPMINSEYLNTLNDKTYMKYSRQVLKSHSLETVVSFINEFTPLQNKRFFAFINESNDFTGTCIIDFEQNHEIANLGFLIFRNFTGKGYGSKMLKLLVEEATKIPSLKFIEIGTHIENLSMIAIAKKAQMARVKLDGSETSQGKVVKFRATINEVKSKILL